MKKLYVYVLVCAFYFSVFTLSAQSFPYFFSAKSEAYVPLENATLALPADEVWDDPDLSIPIGFNFEIAKGSYATLEFVELGARLSFEGFEMAERPYLFIYGSDIADRGFLTNVSESSISYLTEGTPGQRIFKLQWENAGFFQEMTTLGTNNDFVNFQFWLYESTNSFEIRFGPTNVTHDSLSHQALAGQPFIGLVEQMDFPALFTANSPLFYLKDDPATAVVDSADFNDFLLDPGPSLFDDPADGQVYVFSTLPVSTRNLYIKPLQASPQPATTQVDIQVPDTFNGRTAQVSVFNTNGMLIEQLEAPAELLRLSCTHWTPGMYVARIQINNTHFSARIIKQ